MFNKQLNDQIIIQDNLIELVGAYDQKVMKCKKGNFLIFYCLNQNCISQSVFTCLYKQCQCNKKHKKCQKNQIIFTMDNIINKIKQKSKFKHAVNNLINNSIQKLNQLRKSLFNQIQQHTTLIISQIEKEFYKFFINKQKIQRFKSKNLSQMNIIVQNTQHNNHHIVFEQLKQQLNIFQTSNIKNINSLLDQIYFKINHFRIVSKSSIIDTSENYQKMFKLFHRKVSSMTLLYKATQNKFQFQKYFQICGDQTDTIIICRTNKNKVIGGYTPLKFNHQGNEPKSILQYIKDPENNTFLFSLTTNEKFALQKDKIAITRPDKNSHIVFGYNTFHILTKANTFENGKFLLGGQNFNSLHYKDNVQSNLIINGNQNYYFSLKQWEVIKVQFQSQI